MNGITGVSTAYYLLPVGIGTSVMPKDDTEFAVSGNVSIDGLLNVTEVIEKATIVSDDWPSLNPVDGITPLDIQIYLGDNNVYYYTANSGSNWVLDFKGRESGSTSLNSVLDIGESVTVAFLATNGATGHYNTTVKIDGVTQATKWFGGDAPLIGFENSIDSYTYIIIKTADNTFTVLASQSSFS